MNTTNQILESIAALALERGWPPEEIACAFAAGAGQIVAAQSITAAEKTASLHALGTLMQHTSQGAVRGTLQ